MSEIGTHSAYRENQSQHIYPQRRADSRIYVSAETDLEKQGRESDSSDNYQGKRAEECATTREQNH